jgi:hypothetical protein
MIDLQLRAVTSSLAGSLRALWPFFELLVSVSLPCCVGTVTDAVVERYAGF